MILHDFTETENHRVYQYLHGANSLGLQRFLASIIVASKGINHPMVSTVIIKALNYHAISCLHANAGRYRKFEVKVGSGCNIYKPPAWHVVPSLMDTFVNELNYRLGEKMDPFLLSAYSLWRLNYIHPFINGNGRTARALCYYVLCSGLNELLPGSKMLPELIREKRPKYVKLLKEVDKTYRVNQDKYAKALINLSEFIKELINQQITIQE